LGTEREQEKAFRRVWQAFRAVHTVADGRHDGDDWRGHEGVYAFCAIRVPAAALQPGLDALRAALAQFPVVRLHPDHFLHVPLQELGFVCDRPGREDEISPTRLEEFVSGVDDPIAELPAFELALGGANSFQDAAFLEVHDGGACAPIHARLFELAAIARAPDYPYLPHATVAHYTAEEPSLHLTAAIAPWRTHQFGAFPVDRVEVVTMRLDEPYPQLETYATLPLRT
jgi:RNA 2',3'-cyclic 3'-phosphodiesterase